ncbi:putative ribonuclease H-like domain-containing protein [Tanacetum coccineum]
MSPKAVLLKTGLTPLNTVRPFNTTHPKTTIHGAKSKTHFSKQAQSTAQRPFYKQTTLTRRSVHEAKRHFCTKRHYAVNTARSYSGQVNAVRVKRVNAVKSSAYWVWRPTKSNGASIAFKRHNYIDARGRSKASHNMMIKDLLTVGAQVADENQILLKIHRKDNMYSLILKNIVPKESLTCLVVKATLDESMLWHRRLGHINFKNINKLVKDNLGSNTELLEKGIKREYSVARTPQQNGVAERRNRNTH